MSTCFETVFFVTIFDETIDHIAEVPFVTSL